MDKKNLKLLENKNREIIINELHKLFSRATSRQEYLDKVVGLIGQWSGCSHIGIRILDEDGNIPYTSYLGFDKDFLESENWLSVAKDSCACTRVIAGKPQPQDAPYMTGAGSFRCDNTSVLVRLNTDTPLLRGKCIRSGFGSLAVIPVHYRGKNIGAIHLADQSENRVPLQNIEFLESMVHLIGEAVHRFSLEEELQCNYDTQRVINSLLDLSLKDMSLEEIMKLALDHILSVSWLDIEPKGSIFIAGHNPEQLFLYAHRGLDEKILREYQVVPLGKCLCGLAALTGEVQYLDRNSHLYDHRYRGDLDQNHCCVPIKFEGKVLGVINLYLWDGHRQRKSDNSFLHLMAGTLAGIIKRKQTETALTENEKLLRTLVNSMNDIVYTLDTEQRITGAYGHWVETEGFCPGFLEGKNISEILGNEEAKLHNEANSRAMAGENVIYEWSSGRPEGIRYFQTSLSPIIDLHNNVVGLVGVGRDITGSKRVDLALRKSQASLANAQRIARLGNWEWDIVNNVLSWSDEIYRIVGVDKLQFECTYEAFLNLIPPEDRDMIKYAVDNALSRRAPYSLNHRIVLPDGSQRIVHEQAEVTFDENDRAVWMSGTVQDITESKKAQEKIVFQASLLDQVRNAVIATDPHGSIIYWNSFAERLYHWKNHEVLGRPVFDIAFPEDQKDKAVQIIESIKSRGFWEGEFAAKRKDNSTFPALVILTTIKDNRDKLLGFVGVCTDITEIKRSEEKLKSARQKLLDIIEFLPDPTFVVNRDRKVIAWNRAMEEMTGVKKEDILNRGDYAYAVPFYGSPRPILVDLIFSEELQHQLGYDYVERKGDTLYTENYVPQAFNGRGAYLWATASPLYNSKGALTGAIETIRDISHRMKLENQLKYLATHDSLTNIPNRHSLAENLKRAVGKAKRGERGALLLIDLDNFKMVNDTQGHTAGDELLITLVNIMKSKLREWEFLFRFGGDEFALLIEDTSIEEAQLVAERLRHVVEESEICLPINKTCFNLTISVGVVLIDGTLDAQKLLSLADTALYTAKGRGRNKVIIMSPEEDDTVNLSETNRMIGLIKGAIKENRFVQYFQPVYSVKDKKVLHYETLLRMKDQNGQLIMPGSFIPVAERFGLMSQVDYWVVEASLKVLNNFSEISLLINLSGSSLGDEPLLELIEKSISTSAIDPQRIGFEITETTVVKDIVHAERWIRRIKNLGCSFALDDFGMGFSSFSYLRLLPVDYLKIDGSFIQNIDRDPTHRALVQAIDRVAKTLGKKTIAEFVENEAIFKELEKIGVDQGQGYYLGRPAPISEPEEGCAPVFYNLSPNNPIV